MSFKAERKAESKGAWTCSGCTGLTPGQCLIFRLFSLRMKSTISLYLGFYSQAAAGAPPRQTMVYMCWQGDMKLSLKVQSVRNIAKSSIFPMKMNAGCCWLRSATLPQRGRGSSSLCSGFQSLVSSREFSKPLLLTGPAHAHL